MHQKTAENHSGPGILPVYVFLDFDGVTHPWSQAEDFRCLPVLEAVLRDYPETRVVISSDWRTLFSLPKLVVPLRSWQQASTSPSQAMKPCTASRPQLRQ